MSVESCAQGVSNLAIQFGDSDDDGASMSRPFGVAILFAGIDEKGPQLYHMDPSGKQPKILVYCLTESLILMSNEFYFIRISGNSHQPYLNYKINSYLLLKNIATVFLGTFVQFDAKAIGSGSEGAQQSLQEVYHRSMTLEEATTAALTILKQVMEEKLNSSNVEVMSMTPNNLFHMFTKEQVEEVINKLS